MLGALMRDGEYSSHTEEYGDECCRYSVVLGIVGWRSV